MKQKTKMYSSEHVAALNVRIDVLEAKLKQLEQTRADQVEELLNVQHMLMGDVAELLVRCVK